MISNKMVFSSFLCIKGYKPKAFLLIQAVIYGVLNQGLEDQFGSLETFDFSININKVIHFVAAADFLNE